MISGEDGLALFAVLILAAALGIWVETRPRVAQFGLIGIIMLGSLLSALSVVPRQAQVYAFVAEYFLPLAIPLLLFSADLRRIWRECGRLLLAFTLTAGGIVLGALIAIRMVPMGNDGSVVAGIITAGLIGGNANIAAVSAAMEKSADPVMGPLVASAFAVAVPYLAFLLLLPSAGRLWRWFSPVAHRGAERITAAVPDGAAAPITALSLAAAIALSALICALGWWLAEATGMNAMMYLSITVISVLVASAFPRRMRALHGHFEVGQVLIYMFFVVIGIRIDYALALTYGPSMIYFTLCVVVIHFVVLLAGGRLLKLSGPELAVASNACIGGAPTAAAMAVSRRWSDLVTPAILCGVLGYAVANVVGIAIAQFL